MSYNLFSYCENNPVGYIDPTGKCSWKDFFWSGVKIAAIGLLLLSSIPTGGGTLVLAGVGISATTATMVAGAVTASGVAIAGSSLVFMASNGTPRNNQAQNKQFNDAMRELKISDKDIIRRIHDAISGENLTYHEIIEVAKMIIGQ